MESAEDKKTLAFYANRNECLDQWVDKPEIVEQRKVWPDALGLAERAGPDALFRGLRSVLGRDYVSLPGGAPKAQASVNTKFHHESHKYTLSQVFTQKGL